MLWLFCKYWHLCTLQLYGPRVLSPAFLNTTNQIFLFIVLFFLGVYLHQPGMDSIMCQLVRTYTFEEDDLAFPSSARQASKAERFFRLRHVTVVFPKNAQMGQAIKAAPNFFQLCQNGIKLITVRNIFRCTLIGKQCTVLDARAGVLDTFSTRFGHSVVSGSETRFIVKERY